MVQASASSVKGLGFKSHCELNFILTDCELRDAVIHSISKFTIGQNKI